MKIELKKKFLYQEKRLKKKLMKMIMKKYLKK